MLFRSVAVAIHETRASGNTNIPTSSLHAGDETRNPFESGCSIAAENIDTVDAGNGPHALIEAVVDRNRVGGIGIPGPPGTRRERGRALTSRRCRGP